MNFGTNTSDKTIAVLPFVNMSVSEENEYFSDGITEEIINALAKIGGLKVTSRTSAFYFKGKNIPIREIGKELGVSTLLEGSVRLSGNAIRITAQLIDAAEDFHFWSETWDRELDNVFQVQDEISLLIAERLREHFGHFEVQDHLVEASTESVDAYKFYLKGRQTYNKWNPEDVKKSMAFYQQALEIDPNHAESMVGLADAYSFLATIAAIPYEEGWGKCAELTNKALSIDNKLPDAYYQLANLAFFTKCNYREAFEHASKAVNLSPNHVESQQFMAFLYILAGKKVEARDHLKNALSIDPLSQETQFHNGYIEYMSENYDASLQQLDACLEVNPMNIPVHVVKTLCLLKLGRFDETINYFDALPSEIVLIDEKAGCQALGYALKEDETNIEKSEKLLIERANGADGFTADSYRFLLAGAMGRNDDAFAWVEGAMKMGSPLLLLRYSDPLVNPIKSDPRFAKFHQQLFPEDLFGSLKETSKKNVLLDEAAVASFKTRLQQLIETEKPYLNPDLSLRSLAGQLGIHSNQLSWLLNNGFGKNFNEFINHYRIEAFKKMAKDPESAQLTIMSIAYDCGFNSKTVFNTYFKRETGLTPKQFLKG
ncbi:helix-turn-helix domain-containing protein [uncultured Draconibacterium sp.]|uniref:helix-turn-helix domain-containing protein n=1 Tax=uncultured Draconibacterium sp. TaxID=1573823 RepID=UPI0029C71038|nr:helix-turn-helix domain-containing protein [uncultured Draconibacterium sp.]